MQNIYSNCTIPNRLLRSPSSGSVIISAKYVVVVESGEVSVTDGPETVGHQTGCRTRLRPAVLRGTRGSVWCGSRLCSDSDDRIQIHGSTAVVFSPQSEDLSLAEDQKSGIVNSLDGLSTRVSRLTFPMLHRCVDEVTCAVVPANQSGRTLPHRPPIVCKWYSAYRDTAMTYRPCNKGVGDSKDASDHLRIVCASAVLACFSSSV